MEIVFTRIDVGFCLQVGSIRHLLSDNEGASLLTAVLRGVRDIQLETPEGLLRELQYLRAHRRSMDVNEWNARSAAADRALVELGSTLVNESDVALRDLPTGDQQPKEVKGHRGEAEAGE